MSLRIKDIALLTVLKLEYDESELTGETHDLHLHHVIFRSHGGDDVRQNIVCLTRSQHEAYHSGDPAMRMALALHVDNKRPDVAAYIHEKLGGPGALLAWFERHGVRTRETFDR